MLSRAFSRISRSVAQPLRRGISSSNGDMPKASSVVSQSLRQASENSYTPSFEESDRRWGHRDYDMGLTGPMGTMSDVDRNEREAMEDRRMLRDTKLKTSHEFPIDSFETPETVREKGRNIEVLTRWEAVELLSCAKKRQGLNWKEIAKKLDVSEAYAASIFLGVQSVDKEVANKLMEILDIKDARIRDGLSLVLRQVPLRGLHLQGIMHGVGNQVADPFLHRLKEINMMWNVVIKALVHEKLGDGILSTADFGLDVSTVDKGNGNQFVKITMCGKFEPFRKF